MGNPKRVVQAFMPAKISVAGIRLEPFTAATILLLEKLRHPLVDESAQRDLTNQEVMTLVYVLTHPVPDTNALLNQGPDALEAAVMEFAGRIPVGELRPLGQAIRRHFEDALATATGPTAEKKTAAPPKA
ncbi:hypothetical protein [Thermosphaera sp.]